LKGLEFAILAVWIKDSQIKDFRQVMPQRWSVALLRVCNLARKHQQLQRQPQKAA
jgi:hypothetical protein